MTAITNKGFLMQYFLHSCSQLFFMSVVYLTLAGCTDNITEAKVETVQVRPAKLALVEHASGDALRTFPATVEPSLYAHLAFRLNGEIAKVHVVAGNHVNKGDPLASLDDKDYKVQLKQATAKFNLALSQHNRALKLLKDNLISSSEYDQFKAELDIAEAQLAASQNNLEYTVIKAPFDGVVSKVNIEAFEFIQAKQTIMEIQGRKNIDITIQVPEQLMVRLPKGDKASLYQPSLVFDANASTKYKVTLKEHDLTPNAATKSYQVVFTLPTPENINVLPGMTGSLEVELNKLLDIDQEALLVPISAVFIPNSEVTVNNNNQTKYLFKANKLAGSNLYITELVAIQVISIDHQNMIIKPLIKGEVKAGDKIVAAGPHLLVADQTIAEWIQERGL